MEQIPEKEKTPIEECQWCDTTGDVEKNRTLYWGVVFVIALVIIVLFVLSKLL